MVFLNINTRTNKETYKSRNNGILTLCKADVMRLSWHECQDWHQPNESNQRGLANDNGGRVRDENWVEGYELRRALVSSWCHLNSIHLMWFLAAAATFHFAVVDLLADAAAVHQTTIPNSMRILHVLYIPSNDDYQLRGWRRRRQKKYKSFIKFQFLLNFRWFLATYNKEG